MVKIYLTNKNECRVLVEQADYKEAAGPRQMTLKPPLTKQQHNPKWKTWVISGDHNE